jgi:predicted outer membrane protein
VLVTEESPCTEGKNLMPVPVAAPRTLESTVEHRGIGRAAVTLLVLIVPISVVVFGVLAPVASGDPAAVTETDRQLLIKVRQAGLWEIPAGQSAEQQAASQVVKDVGARIASQHTQLDQETRDLAARLGVVLPSQPTEEQQGWLNELSTKWGPEFDQAFANLLRAAHGTVFAVVAQVRAGTRNEQVRAFAQKANDVVKTHMTLLESTGAVDFEALPEPVLAGVATGRPDQRTVAASRPDTGGGVNVGLVVAICVAELGATVGLLRMFRAR